MALPLTMSDPIKPRLEKSVRESLPVPLGAVANFSTGADSPVSAACATKASLAVRNRMSPGSMSPAERRTMSPRTTSRTSISQNAPSRRMEALLEMSEESSCAAEWDFSPWIKEMSEESRMSARMTPAVR